MTRDPGTQTLLPFLTPEERGGQEAGVDRESSPIGITPAGLPGALGIAPADRKGNAAVASSPRRVPTWTTRELQQLWKVPSLTRKDVELLARMKATFEGEVVSVESLTSKPILVAE